MRRQNAHVLLYVAREAFDCAGANFFLVFSVFDDHAVLCAVKSDKQKFKVKAFINRWTASQIKHITAKSNSRLRQKILWDIDYQSFAVSERDKLRIKRGFESPWCLFLTILISSKVCFGSKYRILHLEENHDTRRHLYFRCLRLKNPLPYTLEYAKDQRNRWGVSRKQFLSIFKGATYLTYPAREFIYAPSYPSRKLTKILTSEGHILDQDSSLCKPVEFFRGNLLSCKFSIVFKPCFANAGIFSEVCKGEKTKKKKKGICTCATHTYNIYKKHLPVYIYIHSSLIEPVEITALQIIIIIIDHCVIHSPRLNIMIYLFKKNQRMDTSIQGTQALVLNMINITFAAITSFARKRWCLFQISKPHVNLFLPVTPLFYCNHNYVTAALVIWNLLHIYDHNETKQEGNEN